MIYQWRSSYRPLYHGCLKLSSRKIEVFQGFLATNQNETHWTYLQIVYGKLCRHWEEKNTFIEIYTQLHKCKLWWWYHLKSLMSYKNYCYHYQGMSCQGEKDSIETWCVQKYILGDHYFSRKSGRNENELVNGKCHKSHSPELLGW